MIPKIIHYCWFGRNPLGEEVRQYIQSWEKYCPDYKIKEWNEDNFDINCNTYVKEAYDEKKWAFVTDYVRLYALYHEGGIYMDTDVELLKPINVFLSCRAFSGFENAGQIPTAIMGSEPYGEWIGHLLSYYNDRHFRREDNTLDVTTNVVSITKMTKEKYPIILNNTLQNINDEFTIFPTEYFCPKSYETGRIKITSNTYCIHHFKGSWQDEEMQKKNAFRKKCKQMLGENLGGKVCQAIILVRRKDGSLKKTIVRLLKKKLGKRV